MSHRAKLSELGLELPAVVAPLASYVPAVRTGNLVYTSGQLPMVDGKLVHAGKVGAGVTLEQAADLARIAAAAGASVWTRTSRMAKARLMADERRT